MGILHSHGDGKYNIYNTVVQWNMSECAHFCSACFDQYNTYILSIQYLPKSSRAPSQPLVHWTMKQEEEERVETDGRTAYPIVERELELSALTQRAVAPLPALHTTHRLMMQEHQNTFMVVWKDQHAWHKRIQFEKAEHTENTEHSMNAQCSQYVHPSQTEYY